MTQFFRSGIYEYDKVKHRPLRACASCGCNISATPRKKYCLPCYDIRLQENIAANRHKYAKPKKATRS